MKTIRKAMHALRMTAAVLCAAAAVAAGAGQAMANEVFAKRAEKLDPTKKGSLTLTIADPGTGPLSGVDLELIQVASVKQNAEGNYYYDYLDAYKSCSVNIRDLTESNMGERDKAAAIQSFTKNANISGSQNLTTGDGKISWSDLDLGVYLVQNRPPAGQKELIAPFLVTIPRLLPAKSDPNKYEYVYDVDASEKPELEIAGSGGTPTPKPPTKPSPTPKPGSKKPGGDTPSGGSGGSSGRLPQTGQLWWPVPVLIAAGLLLIVLGVFRRRRGNR